MSAATIPSTREQSPLERPGGLLRNGYALMANTALTAALGLGYWVLAARLFPPSAVGAGSAAVSAVLFVAGVSQLNFMGAITRFLPVAGRRSAALLVGAYAAAATCALVFGTVAVVSARWWAPDDSPLRTNPGFGVLFVVAAMGWTVFVLQDSALTALRRARWVPVENGVFGAAKVVMLLALAGGSATAIFASWTLPAVLCTLPVSYLLFRRLLPEHVAVHPEPSPLLRPRAVARFVGGDYVGSIFTQALLTLMPLLVVAIVGSTGGAWFYVPWVVATTIDLLPGNLATSLIVESSHDEGRLAEYARTVLRRILTLVVPLVAVTVVFAPWLLLPFGGDYSSQSATVLRLLAAATLPRVVSTLYAGVCRVQRRVGRIAAVQAAQAVLVLGAAAALVPSMGIAGAGLASLIGQVLVAAAVLPHLRNGLRREAVAA